MDTIAAVVEVKSELEEIWDYDTTPSYYIHKLAVGRKFKNQRIGLEIIKLLVLRASSDGIGRLRLNCVAHNMRLRQYYQRMGFKFKGTVLNGEVELALYEFTIFG